MCFARTPEVGYPARSPDLVLADAHFSVPILATPFSAAPCRELWDVVSPFWSCMGAMWGHSKLQNGTPEFPVYPRPGHTRNPRDARVSDISGFRG